MFQMPENNFFLVCFRVYIYILSEKNESITD